MLFTIEDLTTLQKEAVQATDDQVKWRSLVHDATNLRPRVAEEQDGT